MEWLQRLTLEHDSDVPEVPFRCERGLCHLSCPFSPLPCAHPGTNPLEAGTRMHGLVGFSPNPHLLSPLLEEKESMTLGGV